VLYSTTAVHHQSLLSVRLLPIPSLNVLLYMSLSRCPGRGVRRRRPTNAYQEFIRDEMKRLKVSHPGMDHQAAFKVAASSKSLCLAKRAVLTTHVCTAALLSKP